MSKEAVCLECNVEFDPTPRPAVIQMGKVLSWYPAPHLHITKFEEKK